MSTLVTDALGTIEGVEEALGVTLTATQRDVVTRLLNGLTAAIHRHTGRKLRSRVYTPAATPYDSIHNGNGLGYMYVPNAPITALTQLTIGLTEFRERLRRAITATSATTLTSGAGFTFSDQDVELSRSIVSVSPNLSTQETVATITSVAGAVATCSAGWSNGTPAITSEWWFERGVYLEEETGKITLSSDIFTEDNKNIRIWYTGGYIVGHPALDHLLEICTALTCYLFRKLPKSGFSGETMGSYSYRLDSPKFNEFWGVNDVSALDQFIDWRKFV